MRQNRSNRLCLLVISASVVSGAAGLASALPPALPPAAPVVAPPRMEFPGGKSHDFGEIFDHTRVTHRFEFVNSGTDAFEITNARSTCGCTVPAIVDEAGNEKKQFAPGERGYITVEFNPKRRQGKEIKPVYVTLNNAPQPQYELQISSFVTQIVAQEPSVVYFRAVEKFGPRPAIDFSLTGRIAGFDAELVHNDSPEMFSVEKVGVEAVGADESGDELTRVHFRATVNEGVTAGRFTHNLRFRTTDSRAEIVEVPMSAQVLSDVQPSPATLMLGRMEAGQTFEKTFRVQSKTGRAFEVKDVLINGPIAGSTFTVADVTEGAGSAFDVTISGTATPRPRQSGQITIITSLADEPSVSLNYSGWVPAAAPGPRPDNNLDNEDVQHLLVRPVPKNQGEKEVDEARENNKRIKDGEDVKAVSPADKTVKKKGEK